MRRDKVIINRVFVLPPPPHPFLLLIKNSLQSAIDSDRINLIWICLVVVVAVVVAAAKIFSIFVRVSGLGRTHRNIITFRQLLNPNNAKTHKPKVSFGTYQKIWTNSQRFQFFWILSCCCCFFDSSLGRFIIRMHLTPITYVVQFRVNLYI